MTANKIPLAVRAWMAWQLLTGSTIASRQHEDHIYDVRVQIKNRMAERDPGRVPGGPTAVLPNTVTVMGVGTFRARINRLTSRIYLPSIARGVPPQTIVRDDDTGETWEVLGSEFTATGYQVLYVGDYVVSAGQ